MKREVEGNRAEMRVWESTLEGREKRERELREEKEKMMRDITLLEDDRRRIDAAMVEAGKWIIVSALFTTVVAIRAGDRTTGAAKNFVKMMDGICEDESGRIDPGDWRRRLTAEEVEKHFGLGRREKGHISRYGADFLYLADFIRNMWAHHAEQGFRNEMELFVWTYGKWPAFWGIIAEMSKSDERMNLPHVAVWKERLRKDLEAMKTYMRGKLQKQREEVEAETREREERSKRNVSKTFRGERG
jgi:hypothetical protein